MNWFIDLIRRHSDLIKDLTIKVLNFTKRSTSSPEIDVDMPFQPMATSAPIIQVPTPILPRQRLYAAAFASLGLDASPNDVAPDEFGCMETVDDIYYKTFKVRINGLKTPSIVSTYTGLMIMLKSPRFKRVYTTSPGVIIICATGTSKTPNTPIKNGHVGICGKYHILSNNSLTGKFDDHFTLTTFTDRYVIKGGYQIYLFEPVAI